MTEKSTSEAQTSSDCDSNLLGLTAAPQEVGLSEEQLEDISSTTQRFVDEEQLAGAVTLVARRGKVAHFEAYGMMDIEAVDVLPHPKGWGFLCPLPIGCLIVRSNTTANRSPSYISLTQWTTPCPLPSRATLARLEGIPIPVGIS